jgi:predicted ATPase/DNA-binding CsgD family transcriptional regulator
MAQQIAARFSGHAASLPVSLTSLIGREQELNSLRDLVRREDVRLITLTGPGGVGKTRLALRVAESIASEYPDGVWFVSLGPVRDPGLVASTIAQALGLRETGGRLVEAGIIAFLRDCRALLVIDNFEHVLEAAPLVSDLVSACPRLTCVLTSRVVLLLSGEHEFPVLPLDVPVGSTAMPVERVAWSPAVRLFVARARAVQPNFEPTNEDVANIAAICRNVDGLPLAIELAAARIRHFAPASLLARLSGDRGGSPLELLTGGPRDVPSRQRSLRDTIAWSYDLLDPEEQAFFCRMSVFAGGFTMEAAEWMTGDRKSWVESGSAISLPPPSSTTDELSAQRIQYSPLDLITSLVDKSLLRRREVADGETRFEMLETIREYGLELLAASKAEAATRDAHAGYFLALAERAEPYLFGPEQRKWLNDLEAEHANLDGALAWFDRRGASEESLRLSRALFFFWWYQGHLAEGRLWLERALSHGADPTTPDWCWVAESAAVMASIAGDAEGAAILAREAKAAAETRGDLSAVAMAMKSMSLALILQGDPVGAKELGESAVALARVGGDDVWLAHVLGDFGTVDAEAGDLARGINLIEEALAIERARGDRLMSAIRLSDLGVLAHMGGDEASAFRNYAESVRNFWEAGSIWYLASPLTGLAAIAAAQEPETATRLIGAAEALRERGGQSGWPLERERDEQAVTRLRATLGEEAFVREQSIGRSMPLSEVITLAEALATGMAQSAEASTSSAFGLSAREREVLQLLVTGYSDKEIAAALSISPRTASKHVGNILAKLGVSSRGEASVHAVREGLA